MKKILTLTRDEYEMICEVISLYLSERSKDYEFEHEITTSVEGLEVTISGIPLYLYATATCDVEWDYGCESTYETQGVPAEIICTSGFKFDELGVYDMSDTEYEVVLP